MPLKKSSLYNIWGFGLLDICLFLVVITMPWTNNQNSYALILFCVAGVFRNSVKDKRILWKRNFYWILPVVYYAVVAASLLWDKDGLGALSSMEKQTSFLVLPFILASLPAFSARAIKTAFLLFAVSVVIACVICLAMSFMEYRVTGDTRVFFYHYLSQHIGINAIYLSLFAIFAALALLFYCFIHQPPISRTQKTVWTIVSLFLSFMIFLLSSKMVIFLFFISMLATILYIFYLNRMLLRGIILSLIIVVGGGWLIWQLPYVKWRVQVTVFKKYDNVKDDQNGLAARQIMWLSAKELIEKKPLIGYGVKNANEQLITKYWEHHFDLGAINKYDAHNVYLQTLLNTGLLGFLPIALMLVIAMVRACRQRNFLLFFLTVILVMESFTESLLETQKGIVFFLFFLLLLYYHSPAGFQAKPATAMAGPSNEL